MEDGIEKVGTTGTINNGTRQNIKYGDIEVRAGVVRTEGEWLISFAPPTGGRPQEGSTVTLEDGTSLTVRKVETSKFLKNFIVVKAYE